MIQKHSTSKFATKRKFKIYEPNKNSQFLLCVSTNTDTNRIGDLIIFLVITNRDFYCMSHIVITYISRHCALKNIRYRGNHVLPGGQKGGEMGPKC